MYKNQFKSQINAKHYKKKTTVIIEIPLIEHYKLTKQSYESTMSIVL